MPEQQPAFDQIKRAAKSALQSLVSAPTIRVMGSPDAAALVTLFDSHSAAIGKILWSPSTDIKGPDTIRRVSWWRIHSESPCSISLRSLVMRARFLAGLLCSLGVLSPAYATQSNLVINGSFETGLTGWSQGTNMESGAAGTCSYNAAVAPGTETITATPGFPATDGTQIALGSVESTSGISNRISCTLYQDIAIPVGTTALTLTYDIAAKAGNNGCSNVGEFTALYSTATIPGLTSPTVGGAATTLCTNTPAATLSPVTKVLTASAVTGTTVRLAFINGAFLLGKEVVGIDNIKLTATYFLSQTISFGATPTLAVGGNGSVSASATSGLLVTFSSNTPSICTVAGTTVTGVAPGTCTIAANQAGDTTYSAATAVTQNIPVTQVSQTIGAITFTPSTLVVGGTTTAIATATSGLTVAFSSSTPSICTIAGTTVTGVTAGTCTVAANQAGNGTYSAASPVTQNIVISLATPASIPTLSEWGMIILSGILVLSTLFVMRRRQM